MVLFPIRNHPPIHPPTRHLSLECFDLSIYLSDLQLTFGGRFVELSLVGDIYQGDIFPCNICPVDICRILRIQKHFEARFLETKFF